jgi:hypothetical protein
VRPRLARFRSAFGVPRYELDEVDVLADAIARRMRPLPDSAVKVSWVGLRFANPLRTLPLQASRNGRGHVLLNLVVIGGGFATSGIAIAASIGHKDGTTVAWIVFGVA